MLTALLVAGASMTTAVTVALLWDCQIALAFVFAVAAADLVSTLLGNPIIPPGPLAKFLYPELRRFPYPLGPEEKAKMEFCHETLRKNN
jgi:hypothetical protein